MNITSKQELCPSLCRRKDRREQGWLRHKVNARVCDHNYCCAWPWLWTPYGIPLFDNHQTITSDTDTTTPTNIDDSTTTSAGAEVGWTAQLKPRINTRDESRPRLNDRIVNIVNSIIVVWKLARNFIARAYCMNSKGNGEVLYLQWFKSICLSSTHLVTSKAALTY